LAQEALALGVVNEVLARERLMPRPSEIAEQIGSQTRLSTRYTRVLLRKRCAAW